MRKVHGNFQGTGSVNLFFRAWLPGNPIKGVLQILHGFGEHSDRYENLVEKLVPQGFAIFAHDHRGHGKSGGIRGHIDSFQDYIEDARQFYASVVLPRSQKKPIFLLGHSMGSIVALNYLQTEQDHYQGAVLSGTGCEPRNSGPMNILVKGLSSALPRGKFKFPLPPSFISRDQEVVEKYEKDPLVEKKLSFRLAGELFTWFEKGVEDAKDLYLPILLQCGSEDQAFQGEQVLFNKIGSKDKKLNLYPGLYHEVYNELEEDRERVLDDLLNWLLERLD